MKRPRLLDLFCGAGGCGMGYHRAGFEVVGVDIAPQPRYPFEFHQADALEYLAAHGHEFDAIHASPPCQAYSRARTIGRAKPSLRSHPKLIDPVMELLHAAGRPFVLENVSGAKLQTHVVLCGSMFGLGARCLGNWHQLQRHRWFDCSFFFLLDRRCRHVGRPIGVWGNSASNRHNPEKGKKYGFTGTAAEKREAMGIDWMTGAEVTQAIPPAYTEYIGHQLMRTLRIGDTG